MKHALLLALPGGLLILAALWLHRLARRKAWRDAPNYVQAIAAWKPDGTTIRPLLLPLIRPLKAQRPAHRVERFPRRTGTR